MVAIIQIQLQSQSSKWSYLMNNVCVYVFKKKHVLRVY